MDAVFEHDLQAVLDSLALEQSEMNTDVLCEQIKKLEKQIDELKEVWNTEGARNEIKHMNEMISELKIEELYKMVELLHEKEVTYNFTSMN